MSLMVGANGKPLANRDGRQLYQVLSPLTYKSDLISDPITVPKGFITDLASVPRIWILYDELGDIAQMPGVVHDYLYSNNITSRKVADKILYEAMRVTGISKLKSKLFYWGVRIGGASHFQRP